MGARGAGAGGAGVGAGDARLGERRQRGRAEAESENQAVARGRGQTQVATDARARTDARREQGRRRTGWLALWDGGNQADGDRWGRWGGDSEGECGQGMEGEMESMQGTDRQTGSKQVRLADRARMHWTEGHREMWWVHGGTEGGRTESTQEGRAACAHGTDGGTKGQTEIAGARRVDGEAVCARWVDGQTYKA